MMRVWRTTRAVSGCRKKDVLPLTPHQAEMSLGGMTSGRLPSTAARRTARTGSGITDAKAFAVSAAARARRSKQRWSGSGK